MVFFYNSGKVRIWRFKCLLEFGGLRGTVGGEGQSGDGGGHEGSDGAAERAVWEGDWTGQGQGHGRDSPVTSTGLEWQQ